jgi:hypothetical protein
MQPIRGGDLGGATDRERPVERFAIIGEQEPRLGARGVVGILGAQRNQQRILSVSAVGPTTGRRVEAK